MGFNVLLIPAMPADVEQLLLTAGLTRKERYGLNL
jgi:hypothetical protein